MSRVCLAIFDPIDGPIAIFHPGLAKNFAQSIALEAHLSLSQTSAFSEKHLAIEILTFPRLELVAYTSLFSLDRSKEGVLALVLHQSQTNLLNENREALKLVASRIIPRIQAESNIKDLSRPVVHLLREWANNPLDFSLRPIEREIKIVTFTSAVPASSPPLPASPTTPASSPPKVVPLSTGPPSVSTEPTKLQRTPDQYFKWQKYKELESLEDLNRLLNLIKLYGERVDSTILTLIQIGELEEPISVKQLARLTMQNELLLKAWVQKLHRAGLITFKEDVIEPIR
ncbi:MAG: hypothetical protein ACFFC7_11270 [Candidatus Hermodarchaeota archaeon]